MPSSSLYCSVSRYTATRLVISYIYAVCCPMQPLYRDLVTAINNADTVITLLVPSTIIVVCNVRISVTLSLFYRSIDVRSLRRSSVVNSSLCVANQPPSRRRRHSADRRRSWAAQSNATIYSNSSYNRLQMKVGFRPSFSYDLSPHRINYV